MTVRRSRNLIELRTVTLTLIQVFAPGEDYAFVREFILGHVPPTAELFEEA